MAGRSRRYSSTSVDASQGREDKITYIAERAALRSVGKNSDPDDWPCYVLEDTTIYTKAGTTIGNLLHAELQGSFVVRGRLVVDRDLRSRLVNKNIDGEYIEVADCQGFSIGSGPVTLWAMGQSGWLEIRPSEKYQKMYSSMVEAIAMYYFFTDLYEDAKRKKNKTILSIDQVLLKFAIDDGTGLVRSEAAEKIKSHAEFLLSQMRKAGSVSWRPTMLFKWLAAECPEINAKLMEKAGEVVLPMAKIPFAVLPPPTPLNLQATQAPKSQPRGLPNHSRPTPPPTRSAPPRGASITTNQPLPTPEIVLSDAPSSSASHAPRDPASSDLPETGEAVTILIHLMHAGDADQSSPKERLTLSKLGTSFYYKYSLKSAPLSQEIIKVHAKAILQAMGSEWKVAPLYAQLLEAASKSNSKKSELRSSAIATTEVQRRRAAATYRKTNTSGPAVGRQGLGRREEMPTPEPTASKSLLPPFIGRRSGKEAGLRLASSPAVKHTGSSDEDNSRPRKRRRPSLPEMGDDDSDTATPPPTANKHDHFSEEDHTPEPAPVSLTIISTPLPTLSPSGPNGTWTCDRPDCSFVVRDAESEKGKDDITEHYNEHAERLEKEVLVMQEASGRRLPVDHLLEKLRKLGEAARLAEGKEVIGGREVVMPIKRNRSMVV